MKFIFIFIFSILNLYGDILDVSELKYQKINSLEIAELSALAYNENILYALSDRGYLYSFSLKIENNKIKFIKPLHATKLKTKKQKNLIKKKRDSEGLYFVDNRLLISFERKPRVAYFSLNGVKIKSVKIAKELQNKNNYRAKNKMLEAVAFSKKYGVITAPELSLKKYPKCKHILYTKEDTFSFRACGNITALEFISEDELLILFRDMKLYTFHLKTLKLTRIKFKRSFKNYKFEGLSKVGKNLYLMVSDNDGDKNQKTLFVLFEI